MLRRRIPLLLLPLLLFFVVGSCTEIGGNDEPCNEKSVCLPDLLCVKGTCLDLDGQKAVFCKNRCIGTVSGFDCSLCGFDAGVTDAGR
ncbi:MAG: hypothetical protein HY791_38140 [Deltaproteobacteria bacterium]|nr:hypothetical protein [Deltaproteobacteria bacterium]